MDFFQIRSRETRQKELELFPDFKIERSKDLMVQGGHFYALWDEERGIWSRDAFDVQRLVDDALRQESAKTGVKYKIRDMESYSTGSWRQFTQLTRDMPDNWHPLDTKLIFAGQEAKKSDYASQRLSYPLLEGDISAWDELMTTLYDPSEREKIEWAIGAVVSGDSKKIQKFIVIYGSAGKGKSTVLNIIEDLFSGYTTVFDGRALGRGESSFATSAFKDHPLVAIQHDGDLSRIEDNTVLNSLIAHERLPINEKYKAAYVARIEAMLFMGTNQPVKISDAKSGIIRRLLDVHPSGKTFPKRHYDALMSKIKFEHGAIACHCLQVFRNLGSNYYNNYRPLEMMLQTDIFYNFIEAYFDLFKEQNYTTLKQAYKLYKEYCEEAGIDRPIPQYKMRDELKNYFYSFSARGYVDGKPASSIYNGFSADKFKARKPDGKTFSLVMDETESILDQEMSDQPAQLAKPDGTPAKKWSSVKTQLSDIDTNELHYLKVPESHIVIDFDLKDANGARALERNLEAASNWPSTYAEISKSGDGIHLHYTYLGDPSELASAHSDGVEVKVFTGDGALRRRLSRCNSVPISSLSSGLKLKEKAKVLKTKTINSEQGLRDLIERNLRKEIHPGTKPSVDFIKKILDDAKESDMPYDVTDLRSRIVAFAINSSNQADNALKVVQQMQWSSENPGEEFPSDVSVKAADDRLAFFDVEVYPNLFVVCWKFEGESEVVRMINPKASEIEELFKLKLVGFYNRRFDNHILYAASMGASPEKLFALTRQLIVDGNRSATYGAAYNLSYADVWDFSTERMSLKKFEIKLGILHLELDLPWDQPVPEDKWEMVVEYCVNDVIATEAVFNDRIHDFTARKILAELSGLTVNDTTQAHTAKIVFGNDKNPQKKFIYTDLSTEFLGYKFERGKSSYKDEDPGEGGYVYAEPGIYKNVVVLDVVSMHPRSIEILNMFGPYTQKYADLVKARVAIKNQDYETARKMLDGRLAPFLEGAENEEVKRHGTDLAFALRIALNIVYGLTSAKFDNPFRDIRNIDNIVAKRGALFMIDLKHELQKAGYTVCHIKTDSVKIPEADGEAIAMVKTIGSMYGYEFDQEATYDKFCLVNDAVYVGAESTLPWDDLSKPFPGYTWTTTGAQFAHPYVFKKLFSQEPVGFDDMCEARSVVKGEMYLDQTGSDLDQPDVTKMRHVGRTGLFVPVKKGGGVLYRVNEGKYYAVSGTKGYLWMEAQVAKEIIMEDEIDISYFEKLTSDAIKTIEKFGSFEELIS